MAVTRDLKGPGSFDKLKGMTKTQAEIIESIAAPPEDERRALVGHLVSQHFDGPSFISQMSEQHLAELDQSITDADQGDVVSVGDVWRRMD